MNPSAQPAPGDPTQRFSDRAADYERYRPSYPGALIEHLRDRGALAQSSRVADIGSGTGISAALFVDAGCDVYAIEPNAAMRAAAERWLGECANFHSVGGRAEATTLGDASIDLAAAGTAFHWFEAGAARVEFARILRPAGCAALFWNVRGVDTDFMRGYDELLRAYCDGYGGSIRRERTNESTLKAFFGSSAFERAAFANAQDLDFDGLRGRMLSSSFVPLPGHPQHAPLLDALRVLFDAHARNGHVTMHYDTRLYLGRIQP